MPLAYMNTIGHISITLFHSFTHSLSSFRIVENLRSSFRFTFFSPNHFSSIHFIDDNNKLPIALKCHRFDASVCRTSYVYALYSVFLFPLCLSVSSSSSSECAQCSFLNKGYRLCSIVCIVSAVFSVCFFQVGQKKKFQANSSKIPAHSTQHRAKRNNKK